MNPADLAQAIAGSPVVLALGWTLVHFLWQGCALGLLFALVHRAARGAGPAIRYWLGMAALAAMLLAAVVTFVLVYASVGGAGGAAPASAGPAIGGFGGELAGWRTLLEPVVPWAVVVWALGLAAHAWGLAGDFRALRHLTANARALPSPWPETVDRLRRQLGIRRCVRVLESVRVGVPIVVGWLRPVIIIPPSAILGLTPRQLELIISHELAHVARHDYLFNLAQIAVETLFFFHPAVRFVSRCVRFEREHCCDDDVVARTGETLAYARALAEIEGLRCSSGLRPAAAATGGHLRGRITRLVALPSARRGAGRWLAGVALLGAVAMAVFGGTRFAARNAETLVSAPVGPAATGVAAAAETVPPPGDARGVAAHGPATTIPESAATPALAGSRVAPEPTASGLVDVGSADAGYVAQASLTLPTPTPASFARFFQVARPVPVRAPGVVEPEFVAPEFVAPEFVEPEFVAPGVVAPGVVAPGVVAPGVVLPPQSAGAAGSPTEGDAMVGHSDALAPAAEPARVVAAVRSTPTQPLAAPATPPSDAAEPGAETPPAPLAADTANAPASAATPAATGDGAVAGTSVLANAATRGLPAPADDSEQDESTGTAVAAAATVEAGATDLPAAADATVPAPGVAEDQPSPVRGAFMSSPAELARPALARAPAASEDAGGGQAAASVDRPAAATIAAAGPSASSPPAESDAPDAPFSALASAGDAPAGTSPSAPSPPEQSRLGEITGGELKRSPNPGYPRHARLNGVEGQVTVRYEVDLRGRVDGLEVLSADPGETFVAAVRKAVRRWRHEPFLADGEPVGARVTRTFEFAIRREPLAAGEKPGAGCQRVTGSRLCRSKDAYQELGIVVVHNPL